MTGKFPPGPNRSIYVWTEISGNFGIMESTPGLHCRALTGKILVFGLGCVCGKWGGGGGGGCGLNKYRGKCETGYPSFIGLHYNQTSQ